MEEEGLIRCICGVSEDDGYTIQCDKCMVWQHTICVKIDEDKVGMRFDRLTPHQVPEKYFCEVCMPRKLDVEVRVWNDFVFNGVLGVVLRV